MEDINMNNNNNANVNKQQQANAQPKQELTVKYKIDDNEIVLTPSIVQNYIVGNKARITPVEFKFFTELCKVRKLNPFLNEAYLIKYTENQPAQLVVGKDAILKRAVLNPQYNGMESGIIVLDQDGNVIERPGTFKLSNVTKSIFSLAIHSLKYSIHCFLICSFVSSSYFLT